MGDAWDEIVAKSGLAPTKPSYGATTSSPKPTATYTANLSNPRVAGALSAALDSARANVVTGASTGLGRNNQLNAEAANLYSMAVMNNLMSEGDLHDWLVGVANESGLHVDANCGPKQIEDTIASGFKAGRNKYGRRDLSHLKDIIDVQFVDELPVNGNGSKVVLAEDSFNSIFDVENGFWDARDSLKQVYTAAMSGMAAPWAVLAFTAARALTIVPPRIMLPAILGRKGSLNWFAAITAPSGGGKGLASSVAEGLIPNSLRMRGLGSGEGIIGAFYKPGNKNTPPEIHESVMFVADEVDTMTALGSRTGQTTMSVLRSGFSGEQLGFSYKSAGDAHLEAHSYRMTLVLSVQPSRAGSLLGDHGGGTLQRFQWFPAIDPRIDDVDVPWPPGSLTLPSPTDLQYGRELQVPAEVTEEIRAIRKMEGRGQVDQKAGHSMFVREKFAYALALIDGRMSMSSEDWELAGIASKVSMRTKLWVEAQLEAAADEEAEQTGSVYGKRSAAADAAKANFSAQSVWRVQQWAMGKLQDGPKSQRELTQAVASRDRKWLGLAMAKMETDGFVEKGDDKLWRRSR